MLIISGLLIAYCWGIAMTNVWIMLSWGLIFSLNCYAKLPSWDPQNFGPGSCNARKVEVTDKLEADLMAVAKVQLAKASAVMAGVLKANPSLPKLVANYTRETHPLARSNLKK